MSWRWLSITALLAAFVVGYGIFLTDDALDVVSGEAPAQPGYYLQDAVITETAPDGSPKYRLAAALITQQPDDESIRLKDVRVEYLARANDPWLLSAERARVPEASQSIEFAGDVQLRQLEAQDGAIIRTESLTVDIEQDIATTPDPVAVEMGTHTLNARGLRADLNTERVQLEADIHGRFSPD